MRVFVLACSLCVAFTTSVAFAQDTVVGTPKANGPRYDMRRALEQRNKDRAKGKGVKAGVAAELAGKDAADGEGDEEKVKIDPKLAEALAAKIRACFAEEAGKPLTKLHCPKMNPHTSR